MRVRIGLGAAALTALIASGCSATVGTTTSTDATSATTLRPGGASAATTTSLPGSASHDLTEAQLTRVLPKSAEIGAGYSVDKSDGDSGDAASDDAMAKACPELAELSSEMSDVFTVALTRGPISVGRVFTDDVGRRVVVSLSQGEGLLASEDQLDEMVRAINRCDTVEVPDAQGRGTTSIELRANPDTHYGEFGLVMTMSVTVDGPTLPRPVDMSGSMRMFQRGGVVVSITTVDGFDPTTYRAVAVDYDLAARLAQRIDGDLEDLQGG